MASICTSADGSQIFIASEDSSTNQLVLKTARENTETIFAAYSPGGGTSCNVTNSSDPDIMFFYGNFGTNVTVIKHTISAVTNTDISPASLGAKEVNTLWVNPSNIDEIVITVDTDQDLLYTDDGGTTWTAWDSALGFDATASWVLWSGDYFPHRYFVCGDNLTTLDILYSPNEGSSKDNKENATIDALTNITNIEATEA